MLYNKIWIQTKYDQNMFYIIRDQNIYILFIINENTLF